MELQHFIGRNEHATIYEEGPLTIKVFDADYPKSSVFYEAFIYSKIEETGLPICNIHKINKQDGHWTIIKDCIPGQNLEKLMEEHPERIPAYLEMMLEMQLKIHTKKSPFLFKLKDKLQGQIESLTTISDTTKYELLTSLGGMPKHHKLCHGNFCPADLQVDENGRLVVYNWLNATQGNASADIANTYLLLYLKFPEAAEQYVDRFCERTGTPRKYIQEWIPIVAAVKLTQDRPQERELLMKWVDIAVYE